MRSSCNKLCPVSPSVLFCDPVSYGRLSFFFFCHSIFTLLVIVYLNMSHILNNSVHEDEFTLLMAGSYLIKPSGSHFTVNLLAYQLTVNNAERSQQHFTI